MAHLVLSLCIRSALLWRWGVLDLCLDRSSILSAGTVYFSDCRACLPYRPTETKWEDEGDYVDEHGVGDEEKLGEYWIVSCDKPCRIAQPDIRCLEGLEG